MKFVEENLEQKLKNLEAAICFYREHLISSQSLKTILIEVYNLLEEREVDKKLNSNKKNAKE